MLVAITLGIKNEKFADQLLEAEKNQVGIKPLTTVDPELTVEEAYHIQLKNIATKIEHGNKVVGKKIGLTSKAMQNLLGVNEPDYGHLLSNMVVENGGAVPKEGILQPKVEAEIAFILKEDLKGPNVTALDVIKATDYVLPAIEIVDSRIVNWKIQLADTIADNASSAFYVLGGKPAKIEEVNLELIGMVLSKNGEIVNTGVGAAALGNPILCVSWLANRLADFDISLRAGEIILSGALSAAVDAHEGDSFIARFAHLGEVSVRF